MAKRGNHTIQFGKVHETGPFRYGDKSYLLESWAINARIEPPMALDRVIPAMNAVLQRGSRIPLEAYGYSLATELDDEGDLIDEVTGISVVYLREGSAYTSNHDEAVVHLETEIAPAVAAALGATILKS